MIDIAVCIAVVWLWFSKFSAKKRLAASVILVAYCIFAGLLAHQNGSTGFAVFLLIAGIFNALAAHRWLGLAYPDKRSTDGKDDTV